MASFNNYTNYDKDSNFKTVVIGAGSKVLEVEINEMQEIWFNTYQRFVKDFVGNGVLNIGKYIVDNGKLTIKNESMLVDGYIIDIPQSEIPISIGDFAYLKVWEDTVDYNSPIYYKGNSQSSQTVKNYIMDERIGEETSRRIQVRYALVTDPGELESTETDHYLKIGQLTENGKFKLVAPIKGHNPTRLSEKHVLKDSQSVITFNTPYAFGTNTLQVYLDGKFLIPGEEFYEVDSSTIRLSSTIEVHANQVLYAVSEVYIQPHAQAIGHSQTHLKTGEDSIDITDLRDLEGLLPKIRAIAGSLDIDCGGFTDANVEIDEEYSGNGTGTGINAADVNITDLGGFFRGYNVESALAEIGAKLKALLNNK